MEQLIARLIEEAAAQGGAGGGLGGARRGATQPLVDELNSGDDLRQQLALVQLCDQLNMASPLAIGQMNPSQLVPPILACLQKEYNPELMLHAARALTYLADSNPRTLEVLSNQQNIDVVLGHLREIKDVELSEQCLTCLEKVCQVQSGATAVLKSYGVAAMLSFVDFFTLSSQRKVWSSTARVCKYVGTDTFQYVQDVLPTIRQAARSEDTKIRGDATASLIRIIAGLGEQPALVEEVFGDMADSLGAILSKPDSNDSTFFAALTLLLVTVSGSEKATQNIIEGGLVSSLSHLLEGPQALPSAVASPGSRPAMSPRYPTSPVMTPSGPNSPSMGSPRGESTAGTKSHRLSLEQTKTVCSTLAKMLVPNREGYRGYFATLMKSPETQASPKQLLAHRDDETEDGEDERAAQSRRLSGEEDAENSDSSETTDDDGNDEEETSTSSSSKPTASAIARSGVTLSTNTRFHSCRVGLHTCDGCSKRCVLGDWYRCNDCRDHDFCGRCLLRSWRTHADGEHTFTDMQALHAPKEVGHSQLEKAKQAMYAAQPALLDKVLVALPTLAKLQIEAESSVIRMYCELFLTSAVSMASPEQLTRCGIVDAPISEAVVTALRDDSVLHTLLGVYLAQLLVEKMPDVYRPLFTREGVASTLQSAAARLGPVKPPGAAQPLAQRVRSVTGWKEIAAEECSNLLRSFSVEEDEERTARLDSIGAQLRAGDLPAAFAALRTALLSDLTAFELSSHKIVRDLKEALVRGNDVRNVVQLITTLCRSRALEEMTSTPFLSPRGADAPGSLPPTPFVRLVRHLQTLLSHLDRFEPIQFGQLHSIHAQVSLHLCPQGTDAPPGRGQRGEAQGTSGSGNDSENARGTSESEGATRVQGRAATVSIEPLANVQAVSTFISRQLLNDRLNTSGRGGLGGGRRGTGGSHNEEDSDGDDDGVEEILPELGENIVTASGVQQTHPRTKPSKRRSAGDPGANENALWIRCGRHVLPPSMTILQLLCFLSDEAEAAQQRQREEAGATDSQLAKKHTPNRQLRHIGQFVPLTLHYSDTPYGPEYTMVSPTANSPIGDPNALPEVLLPSREADPPGVVAVQTQLHWAFPCSRQFLNEEQMNVLTLLGTLHAAIWNWAELLHTLAPEIALEDEGLWSPAVQLSEFENHRLNNKAMRHCSNLLLAGQHLRTWAVNLALDCNYLFAPSTRRFMFEVSFCGTIRSLVRLPRAIGDYGVRDRNNTDHNSSRGLRLQREKKRVWRSKPLECAMEVINGSRRSGAVVLEFEYYGEVGSGLGPTREFYTLVSQALRERKRKLWRGSGETTEDKYYTPLNGLYPRCIAADSSETVYLVRYFAFIGRFLARAILDEQIPALPVSPVVLKLLRGDACGIHDVVAITETLGTTLLALSASTRTPSRLVQLPGQTKAYTVESMGLDFTAPGDDGDAVELVPGGASKAVTSENVAEYCDRMVDFFLHTGVQRVVQALREGFNDYIPLAALRMLTVEELYDVINGHATAITRTEFEDHCLAEHGFTITCRHVQWLFDILASFTVEEQQRFFLFLTGSPHLPVGGLGSLRPKMTVVRKTASDPAVKECDQLPSAMTCQNYLKLPAYDTKEQMEEKLRQAMDEGTGAFLLT